MNSWFEFALVGEDEEHLQAVAEAALDEAVRLEGKLSRFAATSELFRINREAFARRVQIDYEMLAILLACRAAWRATAGYFDPAAASRGSGDAPPPGFAAVEIDAESRTLRFASPETRLDLGGYAKGYALDRAAEMLQSHGVRSALLHAGTSSVLALNPPPGEPHWLVGVRRPETDCELAQLPLANRGLSCSAARESGTGDSPSDIIDPSTGLPLAEQAACLVLASSAAQAEAYSTGLLAMGKKRAVEYIRTSGRRDINAAWIEPGARWAEGLWLSDVP